MVETITPVVHGGRRRRWAVLLALHAAGATLAAAAFGALLGAVGSLLGAPWGPAGLVAVATLAGLYLLREAFALPVPVPQLRRQVPDWWRTFFPFGPASFLYGVGLGVGFFTYLAHGTFVVVSATALAGGRTWLGAAVVAPFGLARGLSAAVAMRAHTPEQGSRLVDVLAAAASWRGWRVAHAVALAGLGTAAIGGAIGDDAPSEAGGAAAAVLAVTFAAAGVVKVVRRRRWRRALASYRLPAPIERAAAAGVPAVELIVAALPAFGLASSAGVAALALLAVLSGAVVIGRLRAGRRLECGCFGTATVRDYRTLLARNAVLAAVALAAWADGVDRTTLADIAAPSGGEVLPAALVVLGMGLAVAVVAFGAGAVRRGARR